METFIDNVRLHQCLWNPQHPDYREMSVRDHAWDQIVKKCNNTSIADVKIARSEWKKLRDNHREALKRAKLGQNKLLPAHITTWKYAKAMQFLEPFMKYRITEDIEMDPPHANARASDHDVSTSEIVDIKTENLSKRRCTDCTGERHDAHYSRHQHDTTDALESFFECILKSTREMPLWMQTQVKKKMFAVIIEAEEQLSFRERPRSDLIILETKIKTEASSPDYTTFGN